MSLSREPPVKKFPRNEFGQQSQPVPIQSEAASSHTRGSRRRRAKRQKTVSQQTEYPPQDLRTWLIGNKQNEQRRDHLDRTIHQRKHRALDRLVSSPFFPEIEAMRPSKKFTSPKFTLYDGKSDPLMHISHYRQMM
ncbi:hypothetical protein HYC85_029871 [Camellia sinensis]|uniref:Uncharacterized protein n=1 Tax=Camellia sinensis TaxID=4442 RepID=A0A7J7FZ34_CAMSI|nr:hypothetical protein HYC85_029871 [Camellia sinensis]